MDPVTHPATELFPAVPPTAVHLFPDAEALASMPERSPLDMPAQSFSRYNKARGHKPQPRPLNWRVWLARFVVFGGAIGLTGYGAAEMHGVLSVGGVTAL